MKTIPLTNSEQTILIDDKNFDRVFVLDTNWYVQCNKAGKPITIKSTKSFFKNLRHGHPRCGARQIILARFIWNIHNESRRIQVDHIHHNIFDCRESETRVITCSQNMMNQTIKSSNTSGFIGVSFNKRTKEFYYRVRHTDGNRYCEVGFKTAEEASIARDSKIKELNNTFSSLNSQREQRI